MHVTFAALALLAGYAGAAITVCAPPLGDKRGFLFVVTGAAPAAPASYSGLLAITVPIAPVAAPVPAAPLPAAPLPAAPVPGAPVPAAPVPAAPVPVAAAAPALYFDKSCGQPFHAECIYPFQPGTAITHNDTPLGLGFPIFAAEVLNAPAPSALALGEAFGLGFVYPGWAEFAGDEFATSFIVNLLQTAAFNLAPLASFPTIYNPPGLTIAQATLPYAYTSGVTPRALPLSQICSLVFPGADTLGASGYLAGFANLPANLPAGIAANPFVPPDALFLSPTEWFLPGLTAGAPVTVSAPGRVWPLPLPLGTLNPPTVYDPALVYALGNIVFTQAAPGAYFQKVNAQNFNLNLSYPSASLIQFANAIYIATRITTAGVLPTAQGAGFALAPVPGPSSPALSPFFAPVPTAAGRIVLYSPNIATPLPPINPALPVISPALPAPPGPVVVIPVVPGGPVLPAPASPTRTPVQAGTRAPVGTGAGGGGGGGDGIISVTPLPISSAASSTPLTLFGLLILNIFLCTL